MLLIYAHYVESTLLLHTYYSPDITVHMNNPAKWIIHMDSNADITIAILNANCNQILHKDD